MTRPELSMAIRRWMDGHPLTERERALVDAAMRLNSIDQYARMAEVAQ